MTAVCTTWSRWLNGTIHDGRGLIAAVTFASDEKSSGFRKTVEANGRIRRSAVPSISSIRPGFAIHTSGPASKDREPVFAP